LKGQDKLKQIIPIMGMLIFIVFAVIGMINESVHVAELITRLILVSTILTLVAYIFNTYYEPELSSNYVHIMYWTFILIGFIPSIFLLSINAYILPILLTTALITTMIDSKLGLMTHLVVSFLLLMVISLPLDIYMMYVVAGLFVNYVIPYVKKRQQIVYVALSTTLLMMLLVIIGHLMQVGNLVGFNYANMFLAGLNGMLVIVLAQGSEPMWETIFNITSQAQLIELGSANQPLMKRLLVEAPGTYHHSMMVANLAEKAAIDIQANYQLARVGAMYHDIGKIEEPKYFSENQNGENIHDDLSPDASAHYIIRHIEKGVSLAKEYKLPKNIIDIIKEHHGDSVVAYFYNKAVSHSDGFDIDVEKFKYAGPKPQTKEAAIVMLADCVDAAAKGFNMEERDMDQIVRLIDQVILTVVTNHQLHASPLRFDELPIIANAFLQVYNGLYHERVKYDRELIEQ